MRWLLSKLLGVLTVAGGILAAIKLVRKDTKKDAQQEMEIKDHENANEIDARVDADRADPDRLSEYDDAGFRD
jgi:hypothetical protein